MKRSWIPGLLVAAVLGISAVAGVDWPTAAYISSVDVQSGSRASLPTTSTARCASSTPAARTWGWL